MGHLALRKKHVHKYTVCVRNDDQVEVRKSEDRSAGGGAVWPERDDREMKVEPFR